MESDQIKEQVKEQLRKEKEEELKIQIEREKADKFFYNWDYQIFCVNKIKTPLFHQRNL